MIHRDVRVVNMKLHIRDQRQRHRGDEEEQKRGDSSQPVFRCEGQPVNGAVMLVGLFGHGEEDRERQRGGRLADKLCRDE